MAPPPLPLLHLVNPAVRRVLVSPLGRWIGALMLIQVVGRRSGRTLRFPVVAHSVEGRLHAMTDRPWRLNFTGGAAVTVTHRGQEVTGRGVLLELSPEEVGVFIRRALDEGESPRALGIKVRAGHDPSVAELAALGQSVIRFDLDLRDGPDPLLGR